MNKRQIEEMEGLALHVKAKESLPNAISHYLDESILRLDKMFLLVCEARAAYIDAKNYHKERDFTKSHSSRIFGTTKLKSLHDLMTHIDK